MSDDLPSLFDDVGLPEAPSSDSRDDVATTPAADDLVDDDIDSSGVVSESSFALFGRNLFGDEIKPSGLGPLAVRFQWPPFSVLDARSGPWQDRKRAWLSLGIQSELGRGGGTWVESATGSHADRQQGYRDASPGGSPRPACDYSNRERGDGTGRPIASKQASKQRPRSQL